MQFFVELECGVVGCNTYDLIEADDELEAERIAEDLAYDNAASYFDVVEEEDMISLEEEGYLWGNEYICNTDLNWTISEYVPEVHDGYLY